MNAAGRRSGGNRWPTRTLHQRFEEKVLVDSEMGCWFWTGGLTSHGYGKIYLGRAHGRRERMAHRVSYELYVGPIPEGLEIDHLCRNTRCVNPAHLEAVSHRENVLRGVSPAAQCALVTHCPQGHVYDKANTYTNPHTGKRRCRACHRIRERNRRVAA